jgi:hypothetical protein
MNRVRFVGVFALVVTVLMLGVQPEAQGVGTVTYIGKTTDVTNFQAAGMGTLGYWFAQFNASGARSQKPTYENQRNGLLSWQGPLNHATSIFDPAYATRSFSQDGPTRSKGGWSEWNTFRLPNGEVGLSGVLLDPYAAANTSQTINRIKLNSGTPSSFLFRIVVDNTAGKHNAINRIRARGDDNGTNIDPNTFPVPGTAGFNGIADVYTFRYNGFGNGDFIKVQFNGMPGGTNNGGSGGASFAGFMFDPAP